METHIKLWDMVLTAGPMVKLVLILLFFMSIISWAIILYKITSIRKIEKETSAFYSLFFGKKDMAVISQAAETYKNTPLSKLFKDARANASAGDTEYLKRILKKTSSMETAAMEKSVGFLATTGSTAPFIGLFGTVWGIMSTFSAIGAQGSATLAVVAPGIAEALIATAMGLFAAIPAVVGYNHIITRIDRVTQDMQSFSSDMLNIAERSASHPTHTKSAE